MVEEEERKDAHAANDNGSKAGERDGETQRRSDALVLTIARALGRQIAREEFARLKAMAANDNQPSEGVTGDKPPGDKETGEETIR